MLRPLFVAAALAAASPFPRVLPAQNEQPAAKPAPSLPAANSPEAKALLDRTLDKMLAYARGTFTTNESHDLAMMRHSGAPFDDDGTEVEGGWYREQVWGNCDGRRFVRANGRMLAKIGDGWKLRRSRLDDGMPAPFALDPELLFTVLRALPDKARTVVQVEAAEILSRRVAILSLQLDADEAHEFVDAGAVPDAGGGFGMPSFLLRMGGQAPPRAETTLYLAFHIDAENDDLLRFGARTIEKNPMRGNRLVTIVTSDGEERDLAEEHDEPAKTGPVQWKMGFPVKKPAKDESVMTFRADFKKLGLAEAPALDDKAKALLRIQ